MGTKTLFHVAIDEQGDMTLAEAINFLTDLAAAQPCPAEEVIIRFEQSGDHWDGYGLAYIVIERAETPVEAVEAAAERSAKNKARQEATRHEELEQLRRLQSKYGTA